MYRQTKFSKLIFILCSIVLITGIIYIPTVQDDKMLGICGFKMFETALMMFIISIPAIFRQLLHINITPAIENSLVAFCFTGLILGDVANFYGHIEWWDTVLHGVSGMLMGFIGYEIINTSNGIYKNKSGHTPFFVFVWIFSFSLAAGTLWEIMEFVTDGMFGLNSQEFLISSGTFDTAVPRVGRNALYDTMHDLILDFIGATAVAAYGYFDTKKHAKVCNYSTKSELL